MIEIVFPSTSVRWLSRLALTTYFPSGSPPYQRDRSGRESGESPRRTAGKERCTSTTPTSIRPAVAREEVAAPAGLYTMPFVSGKQPPLRGRAPLWGADRGGHGNPGLPIASCILRTPGACSGRWRPGGSPLHCLRLRMHDQRVLPIRGKGEPCCPVAARSMNAPRPQGARRGRIERFLRSYTTRKPGYPCGSTALLEGDGLLGGHAAVIDDIREAAAGRNADVDPWPPIGPPVDCPGCTATVDHRLVRAIVCRIDAVARSTRSSRCPTCHSP